MNRRQCAEPITRREGWITVDRPVFSHPDLIVHWRRRQNLDVVDDLRYAFYAFGDVLRIRLESGTSHLSYQRNRAALYEEREVIKHPVIREHQQLVAHLPGNPGLTCLPRNKCIVMIRVVAVLVVLGREIDGK